MLSKEAIAKLLLENELRSKPMEEFTTLLIQDVWKIISSYVHFTFARYEWSHKFSEPNNFSEIIKVTYHRNTKFLINMHNFCDIPSTFLVSPHSSSEQIVRFQCPRFKFFEEKTTVGMICSDEKDIVIRKISDVWILSSYYPNSVIYPEHFVANSLEDFNIKYFVNNSLLSIVNGSILREKELCVYEKFCHFTATIDTDIIPAETQEVFDELFGYCKNQ